MIRNILIASSLLCGIAQAAPDEVDDAIAKITEIRNGLRSLEMLCHEFDLVMVRFLAVLAEEPLEALENGDFLATSTQGSLTKLNHAITIYHDFFYLNMRMGSLDANGNFNGRSEVAINQIIAANAVLKEMRGVDISNYFSNIVDSNFSVLSRTLDTLLEIIDMQAVDDDGFTAEDREELRSAVLALTMKVSEARAITAGGDSAEAYYIAARIVEDIKPIEAMLNPLKHSSAVFNLSAQILWVRVYLENVATVDRDWLDPILRGSR